MENEKRSLKYLGPLGSLSIFLKFVFVLEDGSIDASQIFSRECYEEWLRSRAVLPKSPEETFRKAITAHLKGADGRNPFPQPVEVAILQRIRQFKVWECFANGPSEIGKRGFRSQGYWEKVKDKIGSPKLKRCAFTSLNKISEKVEIPEQMELEDDNQGIPFLKLPTWDHIECMDIKKLEDSPFHHRSPRSQPLPELEPLVEDDAYSSDGVYSLWQQWSSENT